MFSSYQVLCFLAQGLLSSKKKKKNKRLKANMQRYEVQKLQKLPTYQICAHNSTIKKQNIFRNYLFQNFGDN